MPPDTKERQVRQAPVAIAEQVPRPADLPPGRSRAAARLREKRGQTLPPARPHRRFCDAFHLGRRRQGRQRRPPRRCVRNCFCFSSTAPGPFGDPYQVNSANNGPYGDAVTQELIPYVEKTYRGIGQPYARVLDGASTGGWVSLALQVFYPDFFNGAWSHAPDPVDFRAFELINIYEDDNAYVNRRGFERPAAREISGDARTDDAPRGPDRACPRPRRPLGVGRPRLGLHGMRFRPARRRRLAQAALGRQDRQDRSIRLGALEEVRLCA